MSKTIIQIGTNTGNDDLTNIIGSDQPELLVLVEPMDIHNDSIKKHYGWVENMFIENVLIGTKNCEEIDFFYHLDDGPDFAIASLDVNHIYKHYPNSKNRIGSKKVKSINVNDLFEKYKLKYLDILFIDAEGFDDTIIRSIDFSKIEIDNIYFENLHIKNYSIYDFLTNLNYEITYKCGEHGWTSLAKKSKIKLEQSYQNINENLYNYLNYTRKKKYGVLGVVKLHHK